MKPRFDKNSIITRIIILLLIIVLTAAFLPGCKKKAAEPVNEPIPESEQVQEEAANSEQEDVANSEQEPAEEPIEEDAPASGEDLVEPEEAEELPEDGWYYSKDEVALYIHIYGHLPENFITKKEARKLGWSGGSVEKYAEGKAIGGDEFGNYEGNLPEKNGRTYWECDIDTNGKKSRGAKRIVFSSDGLIYYTDDHYETFKLLYGEEDA